MEEITDALSREELLEGKLLESQLNEQAAKTREQAAILETKKVQLQAWLDVVWVKYGKIKGEDLLKDDGTWGKVSK